LVVGFLNKELLVLPKLTHDTWTLPTWYDNKHIICHTGTWILCSSVKLLAWACLVTAKVIQLTRLGSFAQKLCKEYFVLVEDTVVVEMF